MKIEVLLSCMHQKNFDIVYKSKIDSDALVVNQCNQNDFEEINHNDCIFRMISTTSRGLSMSRNIAIENATGDIGIICDDDEIFLAGYKEQLINVFRNNPQIDVAICSIVREKTNEPIKKYPSKIKKMSFLDCLKVSSVEIAFRIDKVRKNKIKFNEQIGSGVSSAGGEEYLFLHDCLRHQLSVYFVPVVIAQICQSSSQWYDKLYTKDFFIDRGIFTKQLIGKKVFATIYAIYFCLRKYHLYKSKMSFFNALRYSMKGIFSIQ